MNRQLQPALTAFALGLIGLGLLALIYADFALVWQPVPTFVQPRSAFAYASGLIMLLTAIGLFFRASAAWSARILFPYLFLWMLLKVPALLLVPKMEAVWLGFGEVAVPFAAGWALFATLSPIKPAAYLAGPTAIRLATILFGLALLPIGLSHIIYAGQTVDLIPTWLPCRPSLAYLTGAGQIACGLAVLVSPVPRLAATIEAAMVALFALLVWAPKIIAAPHARLAWTAFFITWFFAASAWLIAQAISPKSTTP